MTTTIPLPEALKRATKGPCEAYLNDNIGIRIDVGKDGCCFTSMAYGERDLIDADLLAHCRNTLPALVEAVEAVGAASFDCHCGPLTGNGPLCDHCTARAGMFESLRRAKEVRVQG